ncbi:MAG: hypothetical protein WCS99_11355 [Limisphaerales bacterium]
MNAKSRAGANKTSVPSASTTANAPRCQLRDAPVIAQGSEEFDDIVVEARLRPLT